MSRLWNITKAIREVDGYDAFTKLYDKWMDEYYLVESEEFIGFQHYVQIKHREDYNRYVAYARLMGWVT